MANEKDKSYKTSITVRILENHLSNWRNVQKPSGFVNELIAGFFNNKLAKISLPEDIQEKFNKCDTKEYIINKLLIEYFRNNIMFIDDFVRINSLQQQMGIGSRKSNPIEVPTSQIKQVYTNEEFQKQEDSKDSLSNDISENIDKVGKDITLQNVDETTADERSLDAYPILDEPLPNKPLQVDSNNISQVVNKPETVTKQNTRKILFSKK